MKDLICDEFQNAVSELLIRHHSILDVLSKFQEACARTNRATVKAVTGCGCLSIEAKKRQIPPDVSLHELKDYFSSHLNGEICPSCQEMVETELGKTLFYMAALCNLLNLNLYDIFLKEHKKLSTLRIFNFT
ncbi:hypothetical protein Tph_c03830 [Thermacetogenium phaeum DSM 12270]|jgi:NTP pyrophosphatase (non-canonical NTP hydrolase)|uniref:DUF1573 domain-containing protein n=2 Tax=Thermacetogenium phaeum TaxID=85874 RepID=K4LF60_THEPS|nr:hypothetical protein [Thermacetogenium phaeum]AFV10630.1 hypothetical protein Tph_c03830 [Thermacetogenium phaeum DSM 12270]KUK36091.1 MAG: Uncharacterized protein XD66_1200 [Thermacetogenium phaeum]MDK2880260.1 hypothetical protein [Clostridia bacterium]MDN5375626.1 hypothetical protein [Thermacetogenium sp.]